MKKYCLLIPLCATMIMGSCNKEYDDSGLWDKVNSIDKRVTTLETTVSQMNTDIQSMKVIVEALKNNVYVTNVVDIAGIHQITFSDGSTVIIKDGQDGQDGKNGETPFIGTNGNWWIGTTDTGVKAAGTDGKDGQTPFIGSNGNWWIGTTDTGEKAAGTDGKDGQTPFVGTNGNWWVGTTDTGVKAAGTDGRNGQDGLTPHIGSNGNWWIGQTDTGVAASGGNATTTNVPIISIKEDNGVYYWIQIFNGVETWLTDKNGNKLPVTGNDGKDGKDGKDGTNGSDGLTPRILIDSQGYWCYTYGDGNLHYITDLYGNKVSANSGGCDCKQFFQNVYVSNGYLYLILIDGTVIYFQLFSDQAPEQTPSLPREPNIIIPNPQFDVKFLPGRGYVLYIYLTGLRHPSTGDWLKLYGSGNSRRNTWVDIDDKGQIIDIDNEDNSNASTPIDVTFLVDNSGSMAEESDLVARDIIAWAQKRAATNADMQFGCVGYSVNGKINGALDLTTAERLNAYLNYNNRTGTSRTTEFTDTRMRDAAASYTVNDECGGMALRYADANMSFRQGALRFYVNFTDEPNYPAGNHNYSLTWFEDKSNWPSSKGVVHTIYSANANSTDADGFTETLYQKESYRRLSNATGGEFILTNSSMTGVDLESLPITGSIDNRHIINIDLGNSQPDNNNHIIRLTFISEDKTVVGQASYNVKLTAN